MPKTKGVDRTAKKWIERARVATSDYAAGIAAPKRSWSAATTAAANTYFTAVSSPNTKALFTRGVKRAGDTRWSEMSSKKGKDRYATGVELSEPYYKSQMGDILAQIEAVSLGPRGVRGSAENYGRVKQIGDKLHAWRLARAAAASS